MGPDEADGRKQRLARTARRSTLAAAAAILLLLHQSSAFLLCNLLEEYKASSSLSAVPIAGAHPLSGYIVQAADEPATEPAGVPGEAHDEEHSCLVCIVFYRGGLNPVSPALPYPPIQSVDWSLVEASELSTTYLTYSVSVRAPPA